MARNFITIDEIVTDFMIGISPDDYIATATRTQVRNFALDAARSHGFDISKKVQSLVMPINKELMCVELPDDFTDWTKIGIIGTDGLVYVFGENKNLNAAMRYVSDNTGHPVDSNGDGVFDRESAKVVAGQAFGLDTNESFIFRNFILRDSVGSLYGIGGGQYAGEFRVNYELNRIELATTVGVDEVVIEYIADEALSSNPSVHIYTVEAVNSYIYFKIIEKKAGVPNVEKARARSQYYNDRRIANARMKSFTKEEALKTIRKNFKQSPKY